MHFDWCSNCHSPDWNVRKKVSAGIEAVSQHGRPHQEKGASVREVRTDNPFIIQHNRNIEQASISSHFGKYSSIMAGIKENIIMIDNYDRYNFEFVPF
jgi:hypothetical protein